MAREDDGFEDESLRRRDRERDRDSDRKKEDHKERKHRSDRDDERERRRRRSRERRRSRTPDSSRRRRSRDRDGERERDRDRDSHRHRDRDRDSHRDKDGDRDRERDTDGHQRRRRSSRDGRDPDRERKRRHGGDDSTGGDEGEASKRGSLRRNKGPLPSQEDSFALTKGEGGPDEQQPKEKPNFGNTGLLAAASNSVVQADGSSIALKYHEPAEARKPPARDQWRLYVFKDAQVVDEVDLGLQSAWLVGRALAVADLPAEHPSVSSQHAVIQFRHTEKRNEFGDRVGRVKPYLIDLESANGTTLNGEKVPEGRYLELRDKDMIQFGQSTREYVIMLAPK